MSREFNGTNQWLNHTTPMVTGTPFSVSCWFNPDDVTADGSLWWVGEAGSASDYFELHFRGATAGDPVSANTRNGTNNQAVSSAGANGVADVWYHAAGVWTSNVDRKAYFNGGNEGSDTNARTPDAIDESAIGRTNDSTPTGYFNGSIAEIGVWDVALTAAEIAILGKGFSPLFVRPGNLVDYIPLRRDEDEDFVRGFSFTANGTPTIDTHPPMIYPSSSQMRRFAAAAGGASYTPTYSEIMSLADIIAKSEARTLSDTGTLVDTVNKATSRTLTDVGTLVDTVLKNASRTLSDATSLTDTLVRAMNKLQSEALTLTDEFTRVWVIVREYTETLPLVDTVNRSASRILSDTTTLVDTVIRSTSRVLSETATLVDTIVKSTSRTLSDTATYVDSVIKSVSRTISDVVTFVDEFTYDLVTNTFSAILTETLALTDSIEKLLNKISAGIPALMNGVFRKVSDLGVHGFMRAVSKPYGVVNQKKALGLIKAVDKPSGVTDNKDKPELV